MLRCRGEREGDERDNVFQDEHSEPKGEEGVSKGRGQEPDSPGRSQHQDGAGRKSSGGEDERSGSRQDRHSTSSDGGSGRGRGGGRSSYQRREPRGQEEEEYREGGYGRGRGGSRGRRRDDDSYVGGRGGGRGTRRRGRRGGYSKLQIVPFDEMVANSMLMHTYITMNIVILTGWCYLS